MKVDKACLVCGKRAKRKPLAQGQPLCMKHYNMKLNEQDKKVKEALGI